MRVREAVLSLVAHALSLDTEVRVYDRGDGEAVPVEAITWRRDDPSGKGYILVVPGTNAEPSEAGESDQ